MANETITEELFRNCLIKNGYMNGIVIVERQQSENTKIQNLLSKASKSKKGTGTGYPDFILRSEKYPKLLIVVECKALVTQHESKNKNDYANYAVDGVLLYAAYLSKEYDVIAIGVSGQTETDLRISNYIHLQGQDSAHAAFGTSLLSFDDYNDSYLKSELKFNQDYNALLAYSKELNDKLQGKKIRESHRSLLISAALIALDNKAFKASFKLMTTAKEIATQIIGTVKSELDRSGVQPEKITNILHAYSFIQMNIALTEDRNFIVELINGIDENINNFARTHKFFDTIGQFYIEFLRYANSDKGLGIVLTPPHITQLFVELAEIDKDSVVIDNCCGTGGFLISAMRKMIIDAKGNTQQEESIKRNQLIGIEFQDDIYALSVSNMILHGDGKSNIFHGDCFESVEMIREKFKPTVALLNPPYKSNGDETEELTFALNALAMLERNGKCVIILPMSCALTKRGDAVELKRKILEKNTLDAVISLPSDLFHNSKVAVDTCIIIITAHRPHPTDKKTWFGYWKDDGLVKVKNRGRVDLYNRWEEIRGSWLSAYHNKEDIPGHSVKRVVSHEDEWCAEAYMQTDYSILKKEDWIRTVRKFVAYQFSNGLIDKIDISPVTQEAICIDAAVWKEFSVRDLFELHRGVSSNILDISEVKISNTDIPFLRPSNNYSIQNGFLSRNELDKSMICQGMTLVMGNTGQGSHTYTYLIPEEFVPNNNLTALIPLHSLNSYHKIFLINVIELNRYRYAYGRIPSNERFLESKLGLPVTKNGNPDWDFMENYIKALPYSSQLQGNSNP